MSTLRSGPAAGTGLATLAPDGTVLDTWYPAPVLDGDGPDVRELEKLAGEDADRGVRTTVVQTRIGSLADAPVDTADTYLRLHLLSARLVAPRSINLDGIFGLLLRRNSVTGAVEALAREGHGIALNAALHAN